MPPKEVRWTKFEDLSTNLKSLQNSYIQTLSTGKFESLKLEVWKYDYILVKFV